MFIVVENGGWEPVDLLRGGGSTSACVCGGVRRWQGAGDKRQVRQVIGGGGGSWPASELPQHPQVPSSTLKDNANEQDVLEHGQRF